MKGREKMMKLLQWTQRNLAAITWSCGGWIAAGYLSLLLLHWQPGYLLSLGIASLIGFLPVFLSAVQALRVHTISIELLISIAVTAAFLIGEAAESAIVTFLFLFGNILERKALAKTRQSVRELTEMVPSTAWRKEGNQWVQVDVDEVQKRDHLLVKTGAQVPVDARIISGSGYLDEASVTGESRPVRKETGQMVFAGTFLDNGTLHIEAERIGEDTTFGKMIELVEEAQDSKSHTERFIDRFSRGYTPIVLLLTLAVWLWTRDLRLAVTLLVLGCPGALVIGVPVSNVAGIGNGAKHGVLIKGGEIMSKFSRVDTLVFDKTGTLTRGKTEVTDVAAYRDDFDDLLAVAAAIEKESDHPLGRAIVAYAEKKALLRPVAVRKTMVIKGKGIRAEADGRIYLIGSEQLVTGAGIRLQAAQLRKLDQMRRAGVSTVLFAGTDSLIGIFAVADRLRDDVPSALAWLRKHGIRQVIMLTGDNRQTAEAIGQQAGIDKIRAGLLPEDKAAYVEKLKKDGHYVAFIGDGINDSPSIAAAEIGIAMGHGTDVAVETSDLVLMRSRFSELVHAYGLTRKTVGNMKENIGIALATVLLLLAGLIAGMIDMAGGMLIHELSILIVVANAMRLLGYRPGRFRKSART